MELPETHYATSGGVSIAYQVLGDGPFDIVYVPGFVSHLELRWRVPSFSASLGELAEFSRLILFDKRGTGMSDPVGGVPTLETRMDDLRAVMDASGSRRAAIVGVSEGGADERALRRDVSGADSGARPSKRVSAHHVGARLPVGQKREQYEQDLERQLRIFRPRAESLTAVRSLADWIDEDVPAIADYFRWCSSPGAWKALVAMNKDIDVRHVLPAIRVPTLMLHGTADASVPIEAARWTATKIPGAQLVEIPGGGHLHFARDWPFVNEEIRRFLTDVWEAGAWDEAEPGSRAGDNSLHRHRRLQRARGSARRPRLARAARQSSRSIRRELLRFRGQEIDTAGDGFLRNLRRAGPRDPLRVLDRRGGEGARPGRPDRPPHRRVRARRRKNLGNRRAHGSACGRARRRGGSVGLTHREGPRRRLRPSVRGSRIARAQGDSRRVAAVPGGSDGGRVALAAAMKASTSAGVVEPDDRIASERPRPLAPAAKVRLKCPPEQRLAAPERREQRLAVAVPELLSPTDASRRAAEETRKPDADRQVQPDDDVGSTQNEVAEQVLIPAVDHPLVGRHDRLDLRAQLADRCLDPPRAVNEGVELDERHVEPAASSRPSAVLPFPLALAITANLRIDLLSAPTIGSVVPEAELEDTGPGSCRRAPAGSS